RPPKDAIMTIDSESNTAQELAEWEKVDRSTPAGVMNSSKIIMWLVGAAGVVAIAHEFITKGFLGALSLNFIIFFFLILNCFLYPTPTAFVGAHKDSMHLATEVMIQFPFYAGIAGIMSESGLAAIVVTAIVGFATAKSLPIWAYISASVVNLFIPSQGGQFIVQGPLLVDAAQQLGADVMTVINAFVYGDEATNLLQPLYIIPALALVNVKLKDVWGIMAFVWFFWTVFTILGFAIVPGILL
ncbi:MAG: TIGR00366 family protein, partial [Firmicutes bacterium]|nr:TIGR00366 family protein [Bacillota bacterium]